MNAQQITEIALNNSDLSLADLVKISGLSKAEVIEALENNGAAVWAVMLEGFDQAMEARS